MIYTSVPLAKSQTTSQTFLDHEIKGESPAPITESRITAITLRTTALKSFLFAMFWQIVAVAALEVELTLGMPRNILSTSFDQVWFQPPPLVVTFSKKVSEAVETELTALGFTAQSLNKYHYYKGPATENNVRKLVELGAEADAYAPYGTCNINGFLCHAMIGKIFNGTLSAISEKIEEIYRDVNLLTTSLAPSTNFEEISIISSSEDITEKGIFFGYFDGLCLPDKAFVPRFLIGRFSKILGSKAQDIATNSKILSQGWASLSTTANGLLVSHLCFGLNLAIESQVRLQVVVTAGRYRGFVLFGEDFAILKGKEVIKLSPIETLKLEIDSIDQHGQAINSLSEILSALALRVPSPKKGAEKPEPTFAVITPVNIDAPRKLHYVIKDRIIDARKQEEIRQLVLKLQFPEKSWELNSIKHIRIACEAICRKEFLGLGEPFAYKTNALFSHDPIYSTLAAFGLRAPSILGPGSSSPNGVIQVSKDGKFYEGMKGASLDGAPIFAKPLQQAFEDWETVLRTGVITLKHSGNDRNGRAKISGLLLQIPKSSKDYSLFCRALSHAVTERRDKRKRENDEEEPDKDKNAEKDQHRDKRMKEDAVVTAGILDGNPDAMDEDLGSF